jgi:hypothetical protein
VGHIEKRAADGDPIPLPAGPVDDQAWPEQFQKAHKAAWDQWKDAVSKDPAAYKQLQQLDTREKYLWKDSDQWIKDRSTAITNSGGTLSEKQNKSFRRRSEKIER